MPTTRGALAALTGTTALFVHAPYALAALMLSPVLTTLRALVHDVLRWRSDQSRRERDRVANQLLHQMGQDDPKGALELYARLPPPYDPFAQAAPPAEGPAPPPPDTPPADPAAGGAAAGEPAGAG
jgi:hypothetical protein